MIRIDDPNRQWGTTLISEMDVEDHLSGEESRAELESVLGTMYIVIAYRHMDLPDE